MDQWGEGVFDREAQQWELEGYISRRRRVEYGGAMLEGLFQSFR